MKNHLKIIAHRGFSARYPENSLLSFEEAIKHGCDAIELDVHLTKDAELVVHHDYKMGRTAKIKGTIDSHFLSDLQNEDCGSWLSLEFKKQKIPSLREVLKMVDKRVWINIELKHESLKSHSHYQIMTVRVLSLVYEMNYEEHVLITSFDDKLLRTIRLIDPMIKLGILDQNKPGKRLKLKLAEEIKAYSYHPYYLRMNTRRVSLLHLHGMKIFPYTANTEMSFKRLWNLKVDGIITNEVSVLKEFNRFFV
jgi:glycerophosphoryl diester phosphodiesterase